MAETEFLSECRRLIATYRKGHGLCCDIQSELNDAYRNGRIPYDEWKEKTKENEEKMAFFRQQFDIFSERFKRLKVRDKN